MTERQRERYNRHIILPEIGEEGQEKLLRAKVLVVGAGGLGSPVLLYLVAAGIGTIGIIDADVVSLSNLQRQIIYNEEQFGMYKVDKAKEVLEKINSEVKINCYRERLTEENAKNVFSEYEIVVGATDNFASRNVIDKQTAEQSIPFVHGAIQEFQGQVAVFNYKGGPSYSALFPETPDEKDLPIGVMGVLPGVIGSLQATEVIKIVLGAGEILSGKLLLYDALKFKFEVVSFS